MTSRIIEIVKFYNLSMSAFAVRCGLKENTLSNQLNENRKLSLDTIKKVLFTYDNISAEWLMRGEGSMLKFPEHKGVTDERVSKLIDTIAFQQGTITAQEEKIKNLEAELSALRNQKNII